AVEAQWTPPGGGPPIVMWAYVDASPSAASYACPATPVAWSNGPVLNAADGDTFTINLKNCLAEPVSVFIPGQIKAIAPVSFIDAQGRSRVRSFDAEIAPGGVDSYTWVGIKAGTYLYHSGTHPQVQVQMGLSGALVVSGGSYPATAMEQLLVYSEIDPALHAAVAGGTYGTPAYPSTFDYTPQYFLINGETYNAGSLPISIPVSQDILLRFVNAGLKPHTPTLGGGLYMTLSYEDGNLYPFPVEQYGFELPPAKTIDAVLNVGSAGIYPLYDRSLALTNGTATGGGMLVHLQASADPSAPVAANDAYAVAEDTTLTVIAPGVLGNDTDGTGPNPLMASLVTDASAGSLSLAADGSFSYSPNANFNGIDQFTYVANDGGPDSNVATVTITVNGQNDAPVAVADNYDAMAGSILTVAAPGVLGNDSDIDGNPLTAAIYGVSPAGLTFNADGSFSFDATALAAGDSVSFDYVANDGMLDSLPATVTIAVVASAANVAPVAVNDNATTPRNTAVIIDVVANDTDADGTIDPTSVVLPYAITSRGGSVSGNGDGTVTFTPKNGFRGTDTFTYTVNDNDGATSNLATVSVNVTK
ncbi:Ig-like domain-containing protein, partial [Desulfosarcina cetonica]|uniref:Ig-like domain-containing protein n=1 Tax=Desulfosarcina cetonica TaxID=90730 RepID=UPI000A70E9AD